MLRPTVMAIFVTVEAVASIHAVAGITAAGLGGTGAAVGASIATTITTTIITTTTTIFHEIWPKYLKILNNWAESQSQ